MVTQAKRKKEEVLWMADCYSLAKRFHDPHAWLRLLEPSECKSEKTNDISPFHYWLWMEIWKAAQDSNAKS
jgi:hypothetical protein